MMLLYTVAVSLVLLSTNNNVLAFARTPPRQSISITQTSSSSSSTQQHNLSTNSIIPFCAEATSIYNSDIKSWDVHINRLDKENKTNDNSIIGYDVISPRSWMEHIEQCNDQQLHGIGAYTVLRCDATYNFKYSKCQWKIWGIGFHMNRLSSSYRMLMKHNNGYTTSTFSSDYESKLQSSDIITSLLDEATTSLLKEDVSSTSKQEEEYARTLMVTILWTPPKEAVNDCTANYKPIIRGQSTFAGEARTTTSNEGLFPSPIAACLGIPSKLTSEELESLPKRYSNDNDSIKSQSLVRANAKISSWCRIRKPLEDPTRFKLPDSNVGEVLLVTQDKSKLKHRGQQEEDEEDFINSLNILEGLTSNLFVIYKDGTIRTAPVGKVLLGYARNLVKEEIEARKDLQLILNPPTIQDAKDGLWSEVFITSAIRLIVPINRVVIPSRSEEGPTVLWESSNNHSVTRSLWSSISSRGENQQRYMIVVETSDSYLSHYFNYNRSKL